MRQHRTDQRTPNHQVAVIPPRQLHQSLARHRLPPLPEGKRELQPHFRAPIIGKFCRGIDHRIVTVFLGNPQSVLANSRRSITQSGDGGFILQGLQILQHRKRMSPRQRLRTTHDHLLQRRHHGAVSLGLQKHLRAVTQPAVRTFQQTDQIIRTHRIQTLDRRGPLPLWINSVDAPLVVALPIERLEVVFAVLRQPLRMLDHVAIHVRDPERAIRPSAGHHRPAPSIFAGKEFWLAILLRPVRLEGHPVVLDNKMLHEIGHRLASKRVHHPVFAKEQGVEIRRHRTSGSVVAGVGKGVIALLRATHRIDWGIAPRHHLAGTWRRHIRVPAKVTIFQNVMPNREAVLDPEPMSPGIAIPPKLRRTAQRFKLARLRPKTKVAAPKGKFLLGQHGGDRDVLAVINVVPTVRAIHPTIEPPA